MENASKLPRIVAEPDTADVEFDGGIENYGGRRGSESSLEDDDEDERNLMPHPGRTYHHKQLVASSSEATSQAASAFASDTSDQGDLDERGRRLHDNYIDEEDEEEEEEGEGEEDDSFEQVDVADVDDRDDYRDSRHDEDTSKREAAAAATPGDLAPKIGNKRTLSARIPPSTRTANSTRPGTAVPETLEEAIRHYHSVLEEAEKIGVDSALGRIPYNRGYDKTRDNRDELMELARHETLRRLTRLTSELFHRSLETKQIYQLVYETVMSTQARVKQLERQLESYEILKRHKEEDEADLNSLKERIRKVERIALQHAPLNDGGLLDAIEELKKSHIETQKKHKKRRRKEEMIAAGEVPIASPSKSPSMTSIASNRSPRLP